MNDDYLTEQELANAKRYIENNSSKLPEFEGAYITSGGEAQFSYKRIGTLFTKLTIKYPIYEQNKSLFKHLAPNAVAIANSQLKAYAEAHKRHLQEKQEQSLRNNKIDEIIQLLKHNPSQIEPTLQFLLSNLVKAQSLQRGVSDSNVTPTTFTNRR